MPTPLTRARRGDTTRTILRASLPRKWTIRNSSRDCCESKPVRIKGHRGVASVRDYIVANITMKKGTHGAKPDTFNDWILDLIGYQVGDTLDDLFPGTGGMGEAVKRWTPREPNKKKRAGKP